jgi:hypothetical protein
MGLTVSLLLIKSFNPFGEFFVTDASCLYIAFSLQIGPCEVLTHVRLYALRGIEPVERTVTAQANAEI